MSIRFDRNEVAGAFGDLGTSFPLLAGLILVAGVDPTGVLVMFGLAQIATGIRYGLPMPTQPLKAMAALTIAQGLAPETLFGAGVAIGAVMLVLTGSGLLTRLAQAVPKPVVRGIQLGLALQLALLATTKFIPSAGVAGLVLAAAAAAVAMALGSNRRLPRALLLIAMGAGFAIATGFDPLAMTEGLGLRLPALAVPDPSAVAVGFVVLVIPQLPLSLGNSVLATARLSRDLFPERPVGVTSIGWTYSILNLIGPLFGGIPTCHGSGGLAGHHAFGARTGGSVVVIGSIYLGLGLFASGSFESLVLLFPLPLLGVMLLFESATLARSIVDVAGRASDLAIAVGVGACALLVPYGYALGLVGGTIAHRANRRSGQVNRTLRTGSSPAWINSQVSPPSSEA